MKVARSNLMIKVNHPQTNKKGTLENQYKLLFFYNKPCTEDVKNPLRRNGVFTSMVQFDRMLYLTACLDLNLISTTNNVNKRKRQLSLPSIYCS